MISAAGHHGKAIKAGADPAAAATGGGIPTKAERAAVYHGLRHGKKCIDTAIDANYSGNGKMPANACAGQFYPTYT